MAISSGTTVLRRYDLHRQLPFSGGATLWHANDSASGDVLVKAWPFQGPKPDEVERALWDRELRYLFRLANLPGADAELAILHDAGIDDTIQHFVMVFSVPGLALLSDLLSERTRHPWLREVRNPDARAELWRGLRGIARGLERLHGQQMLHRALAPSSVFVSTVEGASSMRLGGFEWTVRLGTSNIPPAPEARPGARHSFESDWYAFGLLAAQTLAGLRVDKAENSQNNKSDVIDTVRAAPALIDLERDVLERLLAPDPAARLARGSEVDRLCGEIVGKLEQPAKPREESYLALVVTLGPGRPLTTAIREESDTILASDLEAQRDFIERDLVDAEIRPRGVGGGAYLLGRRLHYNITEYDADTGGRRGEWLIAYSGRTEGARTLGDGDRGTTLGGLRISVFLIATAKRQEAFIRRNAIPWKPLIPAIDRVAETRGKLREFHEFFRITNQLELLLRDAEIFGYRVLKRAVADGSETIDVVEVARDREVLPFARLRDGMARYIERQIQDHHRGAELVYLSMEESLQVGRRVPREEFWRVLDCSNSQLVLRRPLGAGSPAPDSGFLRTFDMFGQISLIRRRREAIDRLEQQAFVLRALRTPDLTYVDTRAEELPIPLDPSKIDKAKSEALRSIWRTRPLFALQGPPGTGKTTLVANLLGQVFAEDSVAQVLVTAQAHAAVDVLREKVTAETFRDIPEDRRPLTIRLFRQDDSLDTDAEDPDALRPTTRRMLSRARNDVLASPNRNPVQDRWLRVLDRALLGLDGGGDADSGAADLMELVRRSANITYSTTTGGDLAGLAASTQSFDWSIIEEAGKAHGFDLVLPLQAGHRWLLIGDQKQLPPYRFENFQEALAAPDLAIRALNTLPDRAHGLVDTDLLRDWERRPGDERERCANLWRRWLLFFRELFVACQSAAPPPARGVVPPPAAHMLSQQHRMHPTIAGLVSLAYYRGVIEDMTGENGQPLAHVVHPFVAPFDIRERAILWIDRPSERQGGDHSRHESEAEVVAIQRLLRELGTDNNDCKLSLAVLSPYRSQVRKLRKGLKEFSQNLPPWVGVNEAEPDLVHTVDSFQGNQADVVIVSLVRNNTTRPPEGLGFLEDASRINVLLSRAQRLLVLVGSWTFFQEQLAGVPANPDQPLGSWRIALDYLAKCFADGRAVRIPATSLKEEAT